MSASAAAALPPYRERLHRAAAAGRDLLSHSSAVRWEIFAKASYCRQLELAPGAPAQVMHSEEMGVAVRTSQTGRSGFAAASGLEAGAARSAAEGALAGEIRSPVDPIPPPHLLGVAQIEPPPPLPPQGWAAHTIEELARALAAIDPRLRLHRAVVQEGAFAWIIATGEGFVASHEGTAASLLAEVVINNNGPGVWREWHHISDGETFDPEAAAAQIGNRLLLTRAPVSVDSGLRDVILHSEVTAHLLAALIPYFLPTPDQADQLPHMVNRDGQLTTEVLTLVEHRGDPQAPVYGPCDGEGLPSQRITVLEEGVPRHRIASYRDALLCGDATRGGALRLSYRDYPSSGFAGLQVVAAGGVPPAELLADTDRALYLLRPLAPIAFDSASDQCRLVASGVWLDNGRLSGWHPVVEIKGGIGQLLRRIDAIGTDLRWYQTENGCVRAPSLLARRQRVVG